MPDTTTNTDRTLSAPNTRSPFSGRRLMGFLIASALLAVLFFSGLRYLVTAFTHESTDDAFIETSIVAVSPKVEGIVSAVHVKDNQWVNAGDPLVDIDPRDFEITLDRRRAALSVSESNRKSTEAAYNVMKAKLATAEALANQSASEAAASRATANKAQADLQRAEALREQKVLSQQEYDQIRAVALVADASAAADQDKVKSDLSAVGAARAQVEAVVAALEMVQAQIAQARTEVKSADLDLSHTRLVAPSQGAITRKSVQVGEYVQVGQRLLAVVPTNVWVVANFKETQLDHIRPGMSAKIRVDAYPEASLSGHVDSIQAGSGARFSLLPPENAVGNYVKVVQRVPVKIVFDSLPEGTRVLGPGMSVLPAVQTSNFNVHAGVLVLVAGVLALLGAWLGLKALPNRNAQESAPVS